MKGKGKKRRLFLIVGQPPFCSVFLFRWAGGGLSVVKIRYICLLLCKVLVFNLQ